MSFIDYQKGYDEAVNSILARIKQIEIDYKQHDMPYNSEVAEYIHDHISDLFQSVVTIDE